MNNNSPVTSSTIEKTITHPELGCVRIVANYDTYGDRTRLTAFNAAGIELTHRDLTLDQRHDLRSEMPRTNYVE